MAGGSADVSRFYSSQVRITVHVKSSKESKSEGENGRVEGQYSLFRVMLVSLLHEPTVFISVPCKQT